MDQQNYYQTRIAKTLDFLYNNLDQEINITELAKLSNFSIFHFQRIYKALTGESPYESLLRLRLERSLFFLKHKPKHKIYQIAFDSGFPSPENFSRQFKSRFNISPSTFRKNKKLHNSKIYQENSANDLFLCTKRLNNTKNYTFDITIEQLPKIPIAFIRSISGKDGSNLVSSYTRLIDWATKHNMPINGELNRFGISIDNVEVTPKHLFRYNFAIKNPNGYSDENIIELGTIPNALYATIHVIGSLKKISAAWHFLYKKWLPNSNYVPLYSPAIEEFIEGPEITGWKNFNLKVRIPITTIPKKL